jgi:hypothetical protein
LGGGAIRNNKYQTRHAFGFSKLFGASLTPL